MGAPFVATEDKARKDIIRQLERRSLDALEEWKGFPSVIQEMARTICEAAKSDGIWPSSIFLPGDPADVPFGLHFDFTDKWDCIPYAADLVEKRLGITMPLGFYTRLEKMTFAEAVTEICRQKTEQGAVPRPWVPAGPSEGARHIRDVKYIGACMTPQTISPSKILGFSLDCILGSIIGAVVLALAGNNASVRGPAVAFGLMASLIGSGVAVWFAIRAKDRRLAATAVFSLLLLAFWSWVIYEIVRRWYT